MTITVLIAVELALLIVGLGFLLQSQSNSVISNVVATILIIAGLACLAYGVSKSQEGTIKTKDAPSGFSAVPLEDMQKLYTTDKFVIG